MSRDDSESTPSAQTTTAAERPIETARYAWPSAALDPVVRMRALAAALPHAAVDETVFAVPFDRLWNFVADFGENTVRFEGTVGALRVRERRPATDGPGDGERLVLDSRSALGGPWMRFDVVLRPGWCLMQSRLGQVGMAAQPDTPETTRFVHFEGMPGLGRLMRPFFAWNIRQDFRRLRSLLESHREPTSATRA